MMEEEKASHDGHGRKTLIEHPKVFITESTVDFYPLLKHSHMSLL